jgi:hypothetical protein
MMLRAAAIILSISLRAEETAFRPGISIALISPLIIAQPHLASFLPVYYGFTLLSITVIIYFQRHAPSRLSRATRVALPDAYRATMILSEPSPRRLRCRAVVTLH